MCPFDLRQVTQLYTNKAHMIAMGTQLQEQLAMVKVAGTLSKSSEVMKLVNDMMKVVLLQQATWPSHSFHTILQTSFSQQIASAVDAALIKPDLKPSSA